MKAAQESLAIMHDQQVKEFEKRQRLTEKKRAAFEAERAKRVEEAAEKAAIKKAQLARALQESLIKEEIRKEEFLKTIAKAEKRKK